MGRRVPHAGRARQRRQPRGRRSSSREFGAEGIGLCRTEHMFLGDRKQIIQTFILNEDEAVREQAVARAVRGADRATSYGMFKAMDGLPVIVRLLDPPLHEFLESPRALDVEIARAGGRGRATRRVIAEKRHAHGADRRHERGEPDARPARLPPGHRVSRSCRVMQVRAIATAAARLKKEGFDPQPEIMIPLVSVVAELAEAARAWPSETIAEVAAEEGVELDIPVGTMIELPRAAVTADEIAHSGRLLQLRHQRPHADDVRLQPRRRRGRVRPAVLGPAACCRTTPSPPSTPAWPSW